MEIINLQVSKVSDTRQGVEKRQQNLMKQVQSFTNRVMNFEPVDFMNAADASAIQSVDPYDEQTFKDFSKNVMHEFNQSNTNSFGFKKHSRRASVRHDLHTQNTARVSMPRQLNPLDLTASMN